MIKAGIFDVGGVLYKNVSKFVDEDIRRTFELEEDVFKSVMGALYPLLQIGELTEEHFWKEFIKKSNTKIKLPKESLWMREIKKRGGKQIEVFEIVKKLKKEGYRLVILSNTIHPHAEDNKARGIFDDFERLVLSHEVGFAKPDPRIYGLTLEKLEMDPHEAFFVDDKFENIEAANTAGIHGVHFINADQLKSSLRKLRVKI